MRTETNKKPYNYPVNMQVTISTVGCTKVEKYFRQINNAEEDEEFVKMTGLEGVSYQLIDQDLCDSGLMFFNVAIAINKDKIYTLIISKID